MMVTGSTYPLLMKRRPPQQLRRRLMLYVMLVSHEEGGETSMRTGRAMLLRPRRAKERCNKYTCLDYSTVGGWVGVLYFFSLPIIVSVAAPLAHILHYDKLDDPTGLT